jgi:hypothetical protein
MGDMHRIVSGYVKAGLSQHEVIVLAENQRVKRKAWIETANQDILVQT